MRLLLTLTVAAVAAGVAAADEPKKDDKMKKHELKVSFATPNPSWKANITEVRIVGSEIWVKVDAMTDGGIAPSVIGKAEATATVEAPDLPVKYAVFGKTWKWANKEKDITFADDIGKDDRDKWEKAWKDGKPVTLTKKDPEKKDK
jgi:hypothetical protein